MAATRSAPTPRWLDRPEDLNAVVDRWRGRPCLALDTEFVRERTFWPRLALVQAASEDEILLIDPLPAGMPEALAPLLTDPATLKIMHSAGEDLTTLRCATGVLPEPLYDTQIAAALAGQGHGIGYQALVAELTGAALEKGQTRSDWLRRPLSAAQLHYAGEDVAHLAAVHRALDRRLTELGRGDWVGAECARLLNGARENGPDPWPHLALRSAPSLAAEAQRRLCALLRWREAQARALDKPRSWLLGNDLAATLARRPPADVHAFHALLDAHPGAPRRLRASLWDCLAAPLPEAAGFPLARSLADEEKQHLRRMQEAVAAAADQLGLPEPLLASKRVLEKLLIEGGWPEELQGWRRPLLEPALRPLFATGARD